MFCEKDILQNFAIFTGNMSVGAFLNKVAGRQASDFIRKSLQHGFFLVSDAKFLRASTYFEEHMQAMLLLKVC